MTGWRVVTQLNGEEYTTPAYAHMRDAFRELADKVGALVSIGYDLAPAGGGCSIWKNGDRVGDIGVEDVEAVVL